MNYLGHSVQIGKKEKKKKSIDLQSASSVSVASNADSFSTFNHL